MKSATLFLIVGFLAVVSADTWAAKFPLSDEELERQADHIVSGEVVDVTAKTEKSKVETAWGIHRDRIFRIQVAVRVVSKGSQVSEGEQIEVVAWQPAKRIPRLPGLQGHVFIPGKGDTATFYLNGRDGSAFKPLLPNGIKRSASHTMGETAGDEETGSGLD